MGNAFKPHVTANAPDKFAKFTTNIDHMSYIATHVWNLCVFFEIREHMLDSYRQCGTVSLPENLII